MSLRTKILPSESVQLATSATSQTLLDKGLTVNTRATRVRLAFDLNASNPLDASVIARYTYDGQAATDSFGTQIQYGSILNITYDEARMIQIKKISSAPAVNFMVDQFTVEQHRLT